ncbi:MAG: hypothetical protein IJ209_05470 [Bacteroidaceae bacterium]|nr:hypothetical protein [Bacteroidaceae bacterium]
MAIRFTIAKRGLLPAEETELQAHETSGINADGFADERWLKSLRPQLERRPTVDAVEFQTELYRLPSSLPRGELLAALSTMHDVMVHALEKGNAVTLPFIGTFRLSLKGDIEVKDGYYHGRGVHVDGLQFTPDRELLSKVRGFGVEQVPFGQAFNIDDAEIESRLTGLFAHGDTITHHDVAAAFNQTLTRNRITRLLGKLVSEGRLVREGRGPQTRYHAAPGHFGREA